jgi:hypothetical protein
MVSAVLFPAGGPGPLSAAQSSMFSGLNNARIEPLQPMFLNHFHALTLRFPPLKSHFVRAFVRVLVDHRNFLSEDGPSFFQHLHVIDVAAYLEAQGGLPPLDYYKLSHTRRLAVSSFPS